jgi:hypothetical protein
MRPCRRPATSMANFNDDLASFVGVCCFHVALRFVLRWLYSSLLFKENTSPVQNIF